MGRSDDSSKGASRAASREPRAAGPARFRQFVKTVDVLLSRPGHQVDPSEAIDGLMRELVEEDDWLDEIHRRPDAQFYRQYLLHLDAAGRYCVVSFVWGPAQRTPIHDHGTWGVIGMLSGAEISQGYALADGMLRMHGPAQRLQAGDTARVSPSLGDIHEVRNAHDDRVSVSIHIYGTDIGRHPRRVFDRTTGASQTFISGYADPTPTPTTRTRRAHR